LSYIGCNQCISHNLSRRAINNYYKRIISMIDPFENLENLRLEIAVKNTLILILLALLTPTNEHENE